MAYTFCGLKYVYWGYFKGYAKYGAEIRILVLEIGLGPPNLRIFSEIGTSQRAYIFGLILSGFGM